MVSSDSRFEELPVTGALPTSLPEVRGSQESDSKSSDLGVIFPASDTFAEYWLGSGLLLFSFFIDFLTLFEIVRDVFEHTKNWSAGGIATSRYA